MGTTRVPRGLRTAARWSDHLNLNTTVPLSAEGRVIAVHARSFVHADLRTDTYVGHQTV